MIDSQPDKEFRLKGGSKILGYLSQFSSTEKAIFGIFVLLALITALSMANRVNNLFMVSVPALGGEIHEGEVGLPRTVNPVIAVTDVDKDISALVYAGLTKWSSGKIVPDIASSYSISDDGLTYDFKLPDGLRFQDGSALSADDVAFTIRKIQDPALKSPRRADWSNVTVKEISSTEIQFILKQPYAPFLANTTVGIIPKHIWDNVGNDQFIFSDYNISPVGAGPYKVSGITRDSGGIPTEYRLSAWNGYHAKQPFVETVAFDFFGDEDKAVSALEGGSIDSLSSVSPAPASRIATDTRETFSVLSTPLPRIFGVFFNQNQSTVLADRNVRAALDMTAPRSAIVKNVLLGYGIPIHGPLPTSFDIAYASTSATTSNTDTHIDTPDVDAAAKLLEKGGWKKNSATGIYEKKSGKSASTTLSFDLYTADTPDLKQTAEILKTAWSSFGVKVNVKVFEPGDLYQNVIRPRKYDALLFGEQIGKDRDLYAFWHSSERNAPGLNVSMYTNSKVDKLLEDIRTTGPDSSLAEKYGEFDRLIRADIPAVFLYSPNFIYIVPKSINGVTLEQVATPPDRWNSIADWYIDTERVWKIFTKK